MTKSQNTKNAQLAGQFKKGKLEEYKRYYCKTKWFEDIFKARCYNKDTEGEWWTLENEKYVYNNIFHAKDIEVLATVPDYEEWERLNWYAGNGVEENQELKMKNAQLKELLKACIPYVNHRFMETREVLTKPYTASDRVLHKKAEKLLQKIYKELNEKAS